MIFDLHNDILTAKVTNKEYHDMLLEYSFDASIDKIVLAIWTTKLTHPISSINTIAQKFFNTSPSNSVIPSASSNNPVSSSNNLASFSNNPASSSSSLASFSNNPASSSNGLADTFHSNELAFSLHSNSVIPTSDTLPPSPLSNDLPPASSFNNLPATASSNGLSDASSFGDGNKFCFAIEDLHFLDEKNLSCLADLKERIDLVYAGLTWNYDNNLAGGALAGGRLSDFGKAVILELESIGVYVDTAHLNQASFWDVVRCAKKPIINSHCCFDALCNHPRNLTDDQIKAIIDSGGLIGLTFVPDFLANHVPSIPTIDAKNSNNRVNILDVFCHIDYFISRFGFESLAIGTDFYGSSQFPDGLNSYNDFPSLISIMKSHGYSDWVINAITYKNARKLLIGSNH